jgi:acetyl-CoA carboxylase biotin carboxyl carrier protein
MSDSRQFVPELLATLAHHDGGRTTLLAPSPGLWRDPPRPGALIRPGDELGWLEILGVLHRLRAPEAALGVVSHDGHDKHEAQARDQDGALTRRHVDYGARLLSLDPEGPGLRFALASSREAEAGPANQDGTLNFTSPSSGRFYQRASPDKPAFVEPGQYIERGQTIGLLEVMKTFTRVNYDDPKLPGRVKIVAIVAADQSDLGRGDVILQLEVVD